MVINMKNNYYLTNNILRRKYWFPNAIRSIPQRIGLMPRNKDIWVFGCWEGKRYDDNSRYLFEFVTKYHPEIQAFWITSNEKVFNELTANGKRVYMANSPEGLKTMRKAGAAFYTHAIDDFGYKCMLYSAFVIQLNHGPIGAKYLTYYDYTNLSFVIKFLKKLKRYLFDWFKFSYTTTTSRACFEFWRKAYALDNHDKILPLGMPRYDVLLNNSYCKTEIPDFVEDQFRYILYMPTYRAYENSVVSDFLNTIISNNELSNLLIRNKIKFIVKPHTMDRFNVPKDGYPDYIIYLDNNTNYSTQSLLYIADLLITDYSSCCVDYTVRRKPVMLYVPDFDLYQESNGVAAEFQDIYLHESIVRSQAQAATELRGYADNGEYDMTISDLIFDRFNKDSFTLDSYSKIITDFVISSLEKT